jgi:hypothetical protein
VRPSVLQLSLSLSLFAFAAFKENPKQVSIEEEKREENNQTRK